jgi:hypothetical protein
MSLENDGGKIIMTGKNRRTGRKTCPSATLSTTNSTCIDPGSNTGPRGERPATNDLSHGTTIIKALIIFLKNKIIYNVLISLQTSTL